MLIPKSRNYETAKFVYNRYTTLMNFLGEYVENKDKLGLLGFHVAQRTSIGKAIMHATHAQF